MVLKIFTVNPVTLERININVLSRTRSRIALPEEEYKPDEDSFRYCCKYRLWTIHCYVRIMYLFDPIQLSAVTLHHIISLTLERIAAFPTL